MHRTIPTVLILVTAAAGLGAQGDEGQIRYDIRSLVAALTETRARFDYLASPVRAGGAGEMAIKAIWGERDAETSEADAIAQMVRLGLRCDREPGNCADRVYANDGWLFVSGPESAHQAVPGILAALRRGLSQSIQIEVSALPPEALASVSSAVLDAAKADRLLEIAKPLATLRTRARPGSQVVLEAVTRRAYVKDYDTEVAQDMKAADPIIDVLPEGLRLSVRVDPTSDEGFVITVEGQEAAVVDPIRTQMLSFRDIAAVLQLPRMRWNSTSASGRVTNQGALVIGNDLAPRATWMVRVSTPVPDLVHDEGPVTVLPVGAAVREGYRVNGPIFRSPMPSGAGPGAAAGTAEREEAPARVSPEELTRALAAARPRNVPEGDAASLVVGRYAALAGDARFVAAARERIAKLIEERTRGYSFEVRVGTVPAAGFRVPPKDELDALAASLLPRATTAAIAGDRVVLVGGEAHAYLKDRDVEIAQGMAVDDPIVDTFFTGFSVALEALPAGNGRAAVAVQVEYQELIELVPVLTGSREVPETELPRIAAAFAEVSTEVELGSWTVLHTTSLEGTDRQVVVMVRVTAG